MIPVLEMLTMGSDDAGSVPSAKIISFVSFKGGSGRSVSLANVAFQLAKTYRVGCVDFDIEAGGLHKVFDIGEPDRDSIQQFLMDEEDLSNYLDEEVIPDYTDEEVFQKRLVIDVPNTTCPWISPGDIQGGLFLIQALPDADMTYRVDTGMNLFWRFHKLLRLFAKVESLDFILIDCRSGISNLGLPGLAYCHCVSVFLKWGKQHRYGTNRFLDWYSSWLDSAGLERDIYLVPSAVDPKIVTTKVIQDFVANELSEDVTGISLIPREASLESDDFVFCDVDTLRQQKPYKDLAHLLAGNSGVEEG